jgi:hypothetical protein
MATEDVMELIRERDEARFLAACEASRELEWLFFEEEEGRLAAVDGDGIPEWWGC